MRCAMMNPVIATPLQRRLFGPLGPAAILLGVCGLLNLACAPNRPTPPRATQGVLDLRAWNFTQGAAPLRGEYRFYWNELLAPERVRAAAPAGGGFIVVPGAWNGVSVVAHDRSAPLSGRGFATFHLRVLLPPGAPELALNVPTMHTAYRLYAGNRKIAENGVVGVSPSTSVPFYRPLTVRLPASSGDVHLTLHVSNFHHRKGGTWTNIELGLAEQLQQSKERRLILDFALLGSLLVMGLYHLGIFVIRRAAESTLYFGSFCLLFAVRLLTTGDHHITQLYPNITWLLHVRLQYLSYFLAVPVFAGFARSLFPEEVPRMLAIAAAALGGLFSLSVFVLPSESFTYTIGPYQIFTIGCGFVLLASIALSVYRGRDGALLYLVGWLVFFGTIVNDLLYNSEIIQTTIVSPYGLFVFIVAQSTLLAVRFSRAFSTAERLSVDLEMMVHKRTRELLHSRDELQLAKERAERADRAKSEFLTTMSHEIRTPLHSILGAASLLNEGPQTPEHREHVAILERSGRKLLTLINEILDLSKIESGKITVDHALFDLRDVLNDLAGIMNARAEQKNIGLDFNCEAGVPGLLLGDAARLEQVLLNLVGNAIKFTETGGVSVDVTPEARTGDRVTILFSVKDTGIGIPADKRDAIFESFVQAEQDSTRRYGGTGLGLAISRRLVQLMGGEIQVESAVGRGSNFFFRLDFVVAGEARAPRAVKPKVARATPTQLLPSLRVLIADDNTDNLLLMQMFLRKTGAVLETAKNGREALERAVANPFDVILMDIQMPELDGYEATRLIRAHEAHEKLPRTRILALTADATREARRHAEEAGCDGYLTKPIQKEELLEALQGTAVGGPEDAGSAPVVVDEDLVPDRSRDNT